MFSEKQIATSAVQEKKPEKKERSPFAWLRDFGKWFLAAPPDLPAVGSADWYWFGGLCADPYNFTEQLTKLQKSLRPSDAQVVKQEAGFSEQLCNLQKSLGTAGAPGATQEALEGVAVEVRTESRT
jgi:hypothetical protein